MNEANIYLVDNHTFEILKIIDNFVSFIWTDRYNDYGDFELVLPRADFDPNLYKTDRYITVDNNDRYMIIETITINDIKESGRENKVTYTIKGRSAECLLERRVVEKPYYVNAHGNPNENALRDISGDIYSIFFAYFHNNSDLSLRVMRDIEYIQPSYPYPNGGTYGQANNLPSDLSYKASTSGVDYMGKTVGQTIWELCKYVEPITEWPSSWGGKWPDESSSGIKKYNLSIKATKYIETPQEGPIIMLGVQLWNGIDRSYSQTERPVVEFSDFMDNIGGYDYSESIVDWKNCAKVRANFITPDGNGNYSDNYIYTTVKTNVEDADNHRINYRVLFVDSDVERRKMDADGNLTDELYTYDEFILMMKQRGFEALYNYQSKPTYSVELLDYGNYRYGKDYFLGDIVAVKLNNGKMTKARITEAIRSWDNTGFSIYPSFELIED